jgi:uncharacterized membrane protein
VGVARRKSARKAKPAKRDPAKINKGSDPVGQTIRDILKLEAHDRSLTERIADAIATFTGSMTFVWLHVAWFALWILLNVGWLGFKPFDPYPFTFLTMIVSLEAIFLSTFILMSENRQARLGDRRARVNLQVDMIAEREVTKMMELIVDIHDHLGLPRRADKELAEMQKPTDIEHLTAAAETAEEQTKTG